MKKVRIIVHCLVKNEENFVWYAINSVLPFVDKIMIWDNGSTDNTPQILRTIKSPKVKVESHPVTTREAVGSLRQEMLENTPKGYDWLLILDGDEVWSEKAIKKVIDYISIHPTTETVVTRTYNLCGDIYHHLPEKFGEYTFLDKKGNFSLRFISLRNIPGLHVSSPYGTEGYYDNNNLPIQNRSGVKIVDTEYFHATHLIRSSKNKEVIDRLQKHKYYMGVKIPSVKIPAIFFSRKPAIVPSVINRMNTSTKIKSFFGTHLRNLKANILNK